MPEAIVVAEQDELTDATTEISWEPRRDLSYDEWNRVGKTLHTISQAIGWWWGDFLAYGERVFGESYTQILEESEYSRETLKKFKAVATRIPKHRRLPGVSWTAHFAVCYLEAAIVDKILRLADEFGLSVREIKQIAAWPEEQIENLCEYANTHIQLRYVEIAAEMKRLETDAQPETNPVHGDEADASVNGDFSWLPNGDPLDTIKAFFSAKGLPIIYDDETTVVWEGGIRLYVQRGDRDAYLTWERTL